MDYQRRGLSWPFLGMLVCLFALSVTAPRSWEGVARPRAISKLRRAPVPAIPVSRPSLSPSSLVDLPAPSAVETVRSAKRIVGPRIRPATPAVHHASEDPRLAELHRALVRILPAEAIGATRGHASIDDPVEPSGPQLRLAARPGQLKMGPQPADILPSLERDPIARPVPALPRAEQPIWLYDQLERLSHDPRCMTWAYRTAILLRQYHSSETQQNDARRETLLMHLDASSDAARWLAAGLPDEQRAIAVRRVRHALVRRLDVWRLAAAVDRQNVSEVALFERRQGLSRTVAEVAALTSDSDVGTGWQQYLMLDALRSASSQPASSDSQRLARQVLGRLAQTRMDAAQREFAADGPLARLTDSLRHIAAEPVQIDDVLARLERFERSGSTQEGRLIVEQLQHLQRSPQREARELAERIELHYRNCNLRFAISEDLLSRLLPAQETIHEPVRDTILGVPVRGQSETLTSLRVRTIPHEHRLLLSLEARGSISAWTRSQSGPATLINDAWSDYVVRKPIELTVRGLHTYPAEAESESRTRLRNFETDFDGIPLLGSIVRSVVEDRVAEGTPRARQEIERKVKAKALQQMDLQGDERLAEASRRFEDQALARLAGLSLEPTMAALRTTDERAIMRVRLATGEQLAAHTPRPRAPSDSILSLQMHESALNNVLTQLDLNGRQFQVPELHLWIASKLQLPEPDAEALRHEDAVIGFADEDAVQVLCREDRVEVTLSLAEVSSGYNRWSNFSVRVFYRPESNGLHGELVRDGTIQLIGYGLGAKGQIALRGIFSRMFSKERPLPLVPPRLADEPRLADYEVTQFVIDDGWIGLALGPRRSDRVLPVAWAR